MCFFLLHPKLIQKKTLKEVKTTWASILCQNWITHVQKRQFIQRLTILWFCFGPLEAPIGPQSSTRRPSHPGVAATCALGELWDPESLWLKPHPFLASTVQTYTVYIITMHIYNIQYYIYIYIYIYQLCLAYYETKYYVLRCASYDVGKIADMIIAWCSRCRPCGYRQSLGPGSSQTPCSMDLCAIWRVYCTCSFIDWLWSIPCLSI